VAVVPRFELLFREPGRSDRYELVDKTEGELRVDGHLLVDGSVFERDGEWWEARRADYDDGFIRFICIPADKPA
jgi:hypothetical protein